MNAFVKHQGIVAPLDRANVDTDQIIPKQFLKKIERTGFGVHLFHDWRFKDDAGKIENPDFILNRWSFRKATILLAKENFGCGSSREHAPWALEDFGFRVIIAPSFADIFFNNCYKNGMLPVILKPEEIQELFAYAMSGEKTLEVDLPQQWVAVPGGKKYSFSIDEFRKECLLKGLDDIGLTLQNEKMIAEFEAKYAVEYSFNGAPK